jgi:hypothetical protein
MNSKFWLTGVSILFVLATLAACGGGGGGGGGSAGGAPPGGTASYTVGGTVSGLTGTVVLQNNGGDNLSISANGAFTFAAALANSASYNVTVLTQPTGQTCSVGNGAGAVSGANVTNITIICINIVQDSWTGTGSSIAAPLSATAQVTWTLESMTNNVAVYRPTGTASAAVTGCSINPSSGTINPSTDGVLMVDYNVNPPAYRGTGLTQWPATWSCPPGSPVSMGVPAAFFGGSRGTLGVEAEGLVSPDGLTIEGSDTNSQGATFNWRFTRD